MRNVSRQYLELLEYKTDFYPEAEITFLDGTVKIITKDDFTLSNNSIAQSANSSAFPLGAVVSKQINLELMNDDDRWSDYNFYGAKIFLQTKFDLLDGTTETLNEGTFTVIAPETYGATVLISAVDDGYKLDKEYLTSLTYPLSVKMALIDSCSACGISLLTTTFPNDDFIIQNAPEGITHRQFIGYCAMIAGGNACFDYRNYLKIVPYDFSVFDCLKGYDGGIFDDSTHYATGDNADGGSFAPWTTGDNIDGGQFGDRPNLQILRNFINLKVETDDVIITGIRVQKENNEYAFYGKEGYVLSVNNTLAKDKESELVTILGDKLVGVKFRPFTADHIAYPLAEFMDAVVIADRNGNIYPSIITDIDFSYYSITTLKCSADSPIRNSSKYNSKLVESIVQNKQAIQKEISEREKAIENLAIALSKGSGLYMTVEPQPDSSSIYYMHNKPTLEESDIIWKLTAEAFGISTDGGETYPYGFTVTGEMITRLLYAEGINADYINTGSLSIKKGDKTVFLADCDTGTVDINGSNISGSSEGFYYSLTDGEFKVGRILGGIFDSPIFSVDKNGANITNAFIGNCTIDENCTINGTLTANQIHSKQETSFMSGSSYNNFGSISFNLVDILDAYNNPTGDKYAEYRFEARKEGADLNGHTSIVGQSNLTIAGGGAMNLYASQVISLSANGIFLFSNNGILSGNWTNDSGQTIVSDPDCKNSINDLADGYNTLFDNLRPVSYKYNDGTSGRIHTGFIATEVQQAISAAGLTERDFAAVCTLPYKHPASVSGKGNTVCIRYDEIIALNTWQIQKLKSGFVVLKERNDKLEEKVKSLEGRIEKLEKLLGGI